MSEDNELVDEALERAARSFATAKAARIAAKHDMDRAIVRSDAARDAYVSALQAENKAQDALLNYAARPEFAHLEAIKLE